MNKLPLLGLTAALCGFAACLVAATAVFCAAGGKYTPTRLPERYGPTLNWQPTPRSSHQWHVYYDCSAKHKPGDLPESITEESLATVFDLTPPCPVCDVPAWSRFEYGEALFLPCSRFRAINLCNAQHQTTCGPDGIIREYRYTETEKDGQRTARLVELSPWRMYWQNSVWHTMDLFSETLPTSWYVADCRELRFHNGRQGTCKRIYLRMRKNEMMLAEARITTALGFRLSAPVPARESMLHPQSRMVQCLVHPAILQDAAKREKLRSALQEFQPLEDWRQLDFEEYRPDPAATPGYPNPHRAPMLRPHAEWLHAINVHLTDEGVITFSLQPGHRKIHASENEYLRSAAGYLLEHISRHWGEEKDVPFLFYLPL